MPAKKYHSEEERLAARRADRLRYAKSERGRARQAAWDAANPEKVKKSQLDHDARRAEQKRVYMKERRAANLEEHRARARASRAKNAEVANAATRAWKKANPDKVAAHRHKRAGQIVQGDLTAAEWRQIQEDFHHRCAYCLQPGKMELEHIEPIAKGGMHTKDNVIPACRSCNARKSDRSLLQALTVGVGS